MEKRVVLFFILSFLIVVGYPYLMKRLGLMPEVKPVKEDLREIKVDMRGIEGEDRSPVAPKVAVIEGEEENLKEEEITIQTDLYRVVLSNRGATIKEWVLENYKEEKSSEQRAIGLYQGDEGNKRVT